MHDFGSETMCVYRFNNKLMAYSPRNVYEGERLV